MEIYLEMCERWRNLPKPTIAQVQGKCIAGGLMLAWVCDLIIASDDATFKDPVIDFGICGVEFFNHPWELGIRKAKEFFTADEITAQEAASYGMVNRVVPRDELAGDDSVGGEDRHEAGVRAEGEQASGEPRAGCAGTAERADACVQPAPVAACA